MILQIRILDSGNKETSIGIKPGDTISINGRTFGVIDNVGAVFGNNGETIRTTIIKETT